MVPLFNDLDRHEFHVLAVLGYEQKTLKASFAHCPNVTVAMPVGRSSTCNLTGTTATIRSLAPWRLTA